MGWRCTASSAQLTASRFAMRAKMSLRVPLPTATTVAKTPLPKGAPGRLSRALQGRPAYPCSHAATCTLGQGQACRAGPPLLPHPQPQGMAPPLFFKRISLGGAGWCTLSQNLPVIPYGAGPLAGTPIPHACCRMHACLSGSRRHTRQQRAVLCCAVRCYAVAQRGHSLPLTGVGEQHGCCAAARAGDARAAAEQLRADACVLHQPVPACRPGARQGRASRLELSGRQAGEPTGLLAAPLLMPDRIAVRPFGLTAHWRCQRARNLPTRPATRPTSGPLCPTPPNQAVMTYGPCRMQAPERPCTCTWAMMHAGAGLGAPHPARHARPAEWARGAQGDGAAPADGRNAPPQCRALTR